MKTNVEQVAAILQSMHNQARLIIQKKGDVRFNIWTPMRIFLEDDRLFVSDETECTLFTQRSVIDQAMILDYLVKQSKTSKQSKACKHSNAYHFHDNAPMYCPDCRNYL
jgi:hypothetical protein